MKAKRRFSIFLYPFFHNFKIKNIKKYKENFEKHWKHWFFRLNDEMIRTVEDDTYFFLPHIREIIFPEFLEGKKEQSIDFDNYEDILNKGVLRLTFPKENLPKGYPAIKSQRDNVSLSFDIEWIDVFLFPQGIGLLAFKCILNPMDDEVNLNLINDFHYYMQKVHPPFLKFEMPEWEWDGIKFGTRELIDFLLLWFTLPPSLFSKIKNSFEDHISSGNSHNYQIISKNFYTLTPEGQTYGMKQRIYSYCQLVSGGKEIVLHPYFNSLEEQVLYELGTCTYVSEEDYVPEKDFVQKLLEENKLKVWDNWSALVLHDNIIFAGKGTSNFVEKYLPHNIEYDYFHLYSYCVFQEFLLSNYFSKLISRDRDLTKNFSAAEKMLENYIKYENRYWFREISDKPMAEKLYQKVLNALNILPLKEEIKEEVIRLSEYYRRKYQQRLDMILTVLAFVVVPIEILAEFFGNALIKEATWLNFFKVTIFIYAFIFLFIIFYKKIFFR